MHIEVHANLPVTHLPPEHVACVQIQREGTDVTLVAFGRAVGHLLEAAKQLDKDGISAEARARLYSWLMRHVAIQASSGSVCQCPSLSSLLLGRYVPACTG